MGGRCLEWRKEEEYPEVVLGFRCWFRIHQVSVMLMEIAAVSLESQQTSL